MRNKVVAALIAFFLGGLGIHKFYLGKTFSGIVCLLLCWTGIPAIIAFFECIMYLLMSEEKFNKRYNKKYLNEQENKTSAADELKKLHDLKESGVISEEEFEKKKAELL